MPQRSSSKYSFVGLPETPGGNMLVTREELLGMRYPLNCKPHEWPQLGCEAECDRIVEGLERIMDLSIAEPFLVPVDLNAFPMYAMVGGDVVIIITIIIIVIVIITIGGVGCASTLTLAISFMWIDNLKP